MSDPICPTMRKQQVLQLLGEQFAEIQEQFGVRRLALFGSTASGEDQAGSDIDILVEFILWVKPTPSIT
ncbi:nucleotidyltransferase family protein [Synechococcus sp. H55.4]|uniref:nucleotidyltransferase family protein n=2 Tax=Synechococcus TaxID=1129 RepID=UPI0039C409FE